MSQAHRFGDAEARHVVCMESCRDGTKKPGVEPSCSRTNEDVEFRIVHKIYAKYIDCMRVKNSRLAGAGSAGPVPEAFQPPNGKSKSLIAVLCLIFRIPAVLSRWNSAILF